MAQRVVPRTLKGFQDHLPAKAIQRLRLLEKLVPLVERYGFVPLDSPAVEHLDVLLGSGGEGANKELFRFESPEEEPVALRFDLTVPFARLLAQYPAELKPPFRRYAFGPVWRADKPGPGRYRQFTQFDFDHAGTADVAVDAEICSLMCEAMRAVGVEEHRLHVNSRRAMDALLARCGVADAEGQKAVLRVIDKLDKVGVPNVRLELGPGRVDESGDKIKGLGLDAAVIDRIAAALAIPRGTRAEVVASVREFLGGTGADAVAELEELDESLRVLGVDDAHGVFDPSLARGLEYYTGPVFEMKLPAAPQFGTVMAGGRYDGLVERFTPNALAATGGSIGVDRLLAALESLAEAPLPASTVQAMIVVFKGVPKARYLEMAAELRRAGVNTEVFFGKKKAGVTEQLAHANARGVPVAVIAGEDELARGEIAVKDLLAGAAAREGIEDRDAYLEAAKAGQQTIARTRMVDYVKELLARR
ncbi:MAG: histidine--tRNA ligase [Candidatus Sumerlaeia bacterium]|nr:histidine--tRNA ligase [Candidatus Sumerlaeia bacterium]